MTTNRRRFLSLLGIGAASAPLAAKAAVDQQMMSLTALKHSGSLMEGTPADHPPIDGGKSPYVAAESYLKLWNKLPAFVERDLRERAKCVNYLDPDIACKRSWSLNVKIAHQAERNFQRLAERYSNQGKYDIAQETFKKAFGFHWPW